MKYIKLFKEELKSDTYRNAASILRTKHNHHKRASELDKWADDIDDKEYRELLEGNREEYRKNGLFTGTLYAYTNDRAIPITGNFYIGISFEEYWTYSSLCEFWNGDNTFEEQIPLLFYIIVISADDETQDQINKIGADYLYPNDIIFADRVELSLVNRPSRDVPAKFNPNGVISCSSDDFSFKFSDRSNALKFKRLFYNLFSSDMKNEIINFLKKLEGESIPIGTDDYQKILDSIKLISVNVFYRE